MGLTFSFLLGVVPAALVVLGGILIGRAGPPEKADRRLFIYLLAVAMTALLAIILMYQFPADLGIPLSSEIPYMLAACGLGALALALTRLKALGGLSRTRKTVLALAGIALAAAAWQQIYARELILIIGFGAPLLAGLWVIGRKSRPLEAILSLLALTALGLANSDPLNAQLSPLPGWASILLGIATFLTPVLAVMASAVLVSTALQLSAAPLEPGGRRAWPQIWLRLALAAGLLAWLADTIHWAAVWDQTSDGVNAFLFEGEAMLALIVASMFLVLNTRGWRATSSLAYGVLVPALLLFFYSQPSPNYKALTAERAVQIQAGIQRFQARTGSYPAALAELVPLEMLAVPGPVIFRGEDWCYQGGAGTYRLGAVYNEAFGTPISIKVFASVGQSSSGWDCDQRLARLIAAMYPSYSPYDTPYPLVETIVPPSADPVQRTDVLARVGAAQILAGSWSPDGAFLLYGLPEGNAERRQVVLSFLNAKNGTVCEVGQKFAAADTDAAGFRLEAQSAWLADGRLLFLSSDGDLALLTPCQAAIEHLAAPYPEAFEQVAAASQASGRILLRSKTAYWILNGASLSAHKLSGIGPAPAQPAWNQAAWSPDGSRLAISRANGPSVPDGSTLYLVDSQSGVVLRSLALPRSGALDSPQVDWLNGHELLLNGVEPLTLVDLAASPPKISSVVKDLFKLDPGSVDTTTLAWAPAGGGSGYHLALRLDQAVYLYHSESGRVDVLHPSANQVLVFPDGSWSETAQPPGQPLPAAETLELVWVDAPAKPTQQVPVLGHSPRSDLRLGAKLLPGASRLVLSSTQGVSLLALPSGRLQSFWNLANRSNNLTPRVLVAPDASALAVFLDGAGLYYIPLPPED